MSYIYFDNCATTRVCEAAAEAARVAMCENFGNPSSLHLLGVNASRLLQQSREDIAALIGAAAEEIYFTSGGTESNNLALGGAASVYAKKGRRILVLDTEHSSVIKPARNLADSGFEVAFLPVDSLGLIDMEALKAALTDDVILVSVQYVNSETGIIQPIGDIGKILRERGILFHVDAVQAVGKLPISLKSLPVDILSASGHKIHAPKGVGFLYVRKGVRLSPHTAGGGQENNLRSGTENVPGIAAMAAAMKEAAAEMDARNNRVRSVRDELLAGISGISGIKINSAAAYSLPYVLNASFLGTRSEILLHYLEGQGIFVSSGSACSARSKKGSPVLRAMGLSAEFVDSAIRFSFCGDNTVDEAATAAAVTVAAVEEIRALTGWRQK